MRGVLTALVTLLALSAREYGMTLTERYILTIFLVQVRLDPVLDTVLITQGVEMVALTLVACVHLVQLTLVPRVL